MFKPFTLMLLMTICLTACQAVVDRVSEDIADQVSEAVVEQVGTAVAVEVATAIAGSPAVDAPPAAPQPETQMSFSCERKKCTEMSSCQEAIYQLQRCNHSGLDNDKDGVPCQSICSAADVAAYGDAPLAVQPGDEVTAEEEIGTVARVIDGDTIDVVIDGRNIRIRYLQMNTPERDEPCYREANERNAELVAGKTVRLVPDTELVDRYDRWLRYVYVGDVSVSRVLVEEGLAEVVLYPPNDAHYDEFVALEQAAALAGLGCHQTGIFDDGSTTR